MNNYKELMMQVDKDADEIINLLINEEDKYFKSKISLNVSIESEEILKKMINKYEKEVKNLCKYIDQSWSLPIILSIIGKAYYREKLYDFYWIGRIAKRSIPYLWENNFNSNEKSRNRDDLIEAMVLCDILDSLYGIDIIYSYLPDKSVEILNGKFKFSPETNKYLGKYNECVEIAGKRQRVSKENSKLFNVHINEFIESIEMVLKGSEPKNINLFKNTFYENMPDIKNAEVKKFWQGLWTRTYFYRYVISINGLNSKGNFWDVTVFGEQAHILSSDFTEQKTVESMFWNKKWFDLRKNNRDMYLNFIVDRPILKMRKDGIFVTSPALIADSINTYVESQLFGYQHRETSIKLPQNTFSDTISNPFEKRTEELLRKYGFIAGSVNEKGLWDQLDKQILIRHNNAANPGQIDVLAYNQEKDMILFIECKVLHDLYSKSRLKNTYDQLSINGSGVFRKKIKKKIEWLEGSSLRDEIKLTSDILPILLTDIPFPIYEDQSDEIFLLSYDELDKFLSENIK